MITSRSHRVPVAALSPRGFKWGCSPSGVFCYLGGRKGTSQGYLRQGSLASSRRQEWRGVWSRHVMVPEAGGLWTSGFPVRTVCVLICLPGLFWWLCRTHQHLWSALQEAMDGRD